MKSFLFPRRSPTPPLCSDQGSVMMMMMMMMMIMMLIWWEKLASFEATLVRNSVEWVIYRPAGVECRATRVAKNLKIYVYKLCRPPDEIPRAFYENSGGKEKEALGSNGVMADLNIGLTFFFFHPLLSMSYYQYCVTFLFVILFFLSFCQSLLSWWAIAWWRTSILVCLHISFPC